MKVNAAHARETCEIVEADESQNGGEAPVVSFVSTSASSERTSQVLQKASFLPRKDTRVQRSFHQRRRRHSSSGILIIPGADTRNEQASEPNDGRA